MDENSFDMPQKIAPKATELVNSGTDMNISLPPHSVTVLDLQLDHVMHSAI